MCNQNITQILNVDHSTSNDEFNWLTNSSNPINTTNGQLVLVPDVATATFRRGLGSLDPTNDRIRLQINMDLFRPQSSTQDKIHAIFGIYIGTTLINQFSIYKQGIAVGEKIQFNFDRVYKYDSLSGNISLKISFVDGWENQLLLDYTKCEHFKYCQENVRTYFVLNNYLEDCLNAVSSGIQLLEWKVDGVETLTPSFFTENNSPGGNLSTRRFAKANIDGSNRVSENSNPNSFNPFVKDLGLLFDTANSFHGGKPTGTVSGSNYGSAILQIGVDKPSVMNGQLNSKKGAFFIDIDFSKSLKIVFNALVNNTNQSLFQNPSIFRKYFIIWNAENCTRQFYYQDQLSQNPLTNIPVDEDGFLSGITDGVSTQTIIGCNQSFAYNGQSGTYETQIDFGTAVGIAGINYNANQIPDNFEIEWNGQIVTTGYVGKSSYDQQLINAGVNPSQINTTPAGNGSGQLTFFKDQPFPSIATIRVTAPLGGTAWNISGICPQPIQQNEFTEIVWDDTGTTEDRVGNANSVDIRVNSFIYPMTNVVLETAINGIWLPSVVFPTENSVTNLSVLAGVNQFRLKGTRVSDGATVYSNTLQYNKTTNQGGTVLALRSGQSVVNGDNGCSLALTENCWLTTSNAGGMPIVSGDRVWNYNQTPFDGQNRFWKIQSAIASQSDPSYVCQVDSQGFIQVHTICI